MSEDRDFKGVWIPKEIWLNTELTMLEKCIFVEIDSLDNENHCTAGNEYFARFCDCSESKVSKAITKLQDLGMIEILSFDGRHRVIAVLGRVVKNARQSSKKYEAESQKVRANNIDNNTKNSILSKDKNTVDFQFGKKPTKQPTLYEKCVNLIDDFTDSNTLRKELITALKQFIENSRESNIPFYTNNFKGKLNHLEKITTSVPDMIAIVQQTIERGWNDFYPLNTSCKKAGKTGNVAVDIEGLDPTQMRHATAEEKQKFKEDIANGKAEKF